ncbi:fatty acid desaturase family protein [Trinickia caryophylli]|uniref:Fatty acid desaturase n=1 Tax=Trinickia caryophylli TaxID=28094 RepID=A0A1X7D3V1_TRICW|nr:fatty acid desaturase family protein [Trinickia caryophylli]PMS12761.1 fatty acid desaturase [Trinickia caryophylli]TRX15169.1 fatty acid desaturase [Trinickia caryophylli]WQE15033.1 fatty acid desaturase family protein [Trinickia caryophylli]SMF08406.1 Fatty acid desaturase [Trinickia caryophylli]GLU31234.1 fatty acid desaturase [Trinickia caryophylli]
MSNTQNCSRDSDTRHGAYRLIGGAGDAAHAAGLVNAVWYKCPVPRATMKSLMQRHDARAIADTIVWYAAIAASGVWAWLAWRADSLWAIPAFFAYGTLYCSPADSRWHECGHGTAFKTRWMNDVLYQLASFQVFRRATVWRWSHARHHTDTLVVGRDPEIAAPRPTDWFGLLLNVFALKHVSKELPKMVSNAFGNIGAEDKTFVPESEWPKAVREARIMLAIHAAVIAASVASHSVLPLLYIGLPSLYGAWLYLYLGLTQHAGLPENVLDHRKNCRTVKMNSVFRFLYWNMNYHIEHHMFPMVPFHALERLHEIVRDDMPPPYPSTLSAYAEIIPALMRQTRDPSYHVIRPVPETSRM